MLLSELSTAEDQQPQFQTTPVTGRGRKMSLVDRIELSVDLSFRVGRFFLRLPGARQKYFGVVCLEENTLPVRPRIRIASAERSRGIQSFHATSLYHSILRPLRGKRIGK